MDDAPPGRHPLTIAGLDDAPIANRVGMLDLPVEGNGDGLESAVRMLSYATGGAIVRWKVARGSVIEHEEGRQLLRECFVSKDWVNSEAIPDPMRGYVYVLFWLGEWKTNEAQEMRGGGGAESMYHAPTHNCKMSDTQIYSHLRGFCMT